MPSDWAEHELFLEVGGLEAPADDWLACLFQDNSDIVTNYCEEYCFDVDCAYDTTVRSRGPR